MSCLAKLHDLKDPATNSWPAGWKGERKEGRVKQVLKEPYQVLGARICILEMAAALGETAQQYLDETLIPGDWHGEEAALARREKEELVRCLHSSAYTGG